MRNQNSPLEIILRVLLSVGILGVAGLIFWKLGKAKEKPAPPPVSAEIAVSTVPAIVHDGGIELEVDGVVVPFRQVRIATEVSGTVIEKVGDWRIGSTVKRGQRLVSIDKRNYKHDVNRLNKELAQAENQIAELVVEVASVKNRISYAEKQLVLAEQELERYEKAERNVFSASEVNAAARAKVTAEDNLQTQRDQQLLLEKRRVRLESGRDLVQVQLERAKLDLERTDIHSPISGVVIASSVEEDGYLQIGGEVAIIQDTSQVEVTCNLRMQELYWIWQSELSSPQAESEAEHLESKTSDPSASPGQDFEADANEAPKTDPPPEIEVAVEEDTTSHLAYQIPTQEVTVIYRLDGAEFRWEGLLDRFDGSGMDERTRMARCRVHVKNPDEVKTKSHLRPPMLLTGTFVELRLDVHPGLELLRVPKRAVLPGNILWVVRNDELVKLRVRFKDGKQDRSTGKVEHVIVFKEAGGLIAGDQVVVSTLAAPEEGAAVKVINES